MKPGCLTSNSLHKFYANMHNFYANNHIDNHINNVYNRNFNQRGGRNNVILWYLANPSNPHLFFFCKSFNSTITRLLTFSRPFTYLTSPSMACRRTCVVSSGCSVIQNLIGCGNDDASYVIALRSCVIWLRKSAETKIKSNKYFEKKKE